MRLKLHIAQASLILLIGATLAIVSAWIPAYSVSKASPPRRLEPTTPAHAWRLSFIPEATIMHWFEYRATGVRIDEVWFTMWSGGSPGGNQGSTYVSMGWPIPCLQMRDTGLFSGAASGRALGGLARLGIFTLPSGSAATTPPATTARTVQDWWIYGLQLGAHRYPLRPLPLAFFVNTLAWSLVVLAAYLIHTRLRDRRRASKGLCTACGYPVAGMSVCPECGAPRVPPQPRPDSVTP